MCPNQTRVRRPRLCRCARLSQLRRASQPVIGLGVLNQHLGYFVRRLQVWVVFQDSSQALAHRYQPGAILVLVVISANSGLSQSNWRRLWASSGVTRCGCASTAERRGLHAPPQLGVRRFDAATHFASPATARSFWHAPKRWPRYPAALKVSRRQRYRLALETLREFYACPSSARPRQAGPSAFTNPANRGSWISPARE